MLLAKPRIVSYNEEPAPEGSGYGRWIWGPGLCPDCHSEYQVFQNSRLTIKFIRCSRCEWWVDLRPRKKNRGVVNGLRAVVDAASTMRDGQYKQRGLK